VCGMGVQGELAVHARQQGSIAAARVHAMAVFFLCAQRATRSLGVCSKVHVTQNRSVAPRA